MHKFRPITQYYGECFDDRRVELSTGASAQLGDRELVAAPLAVDTVKIECGVVSTPTRLGQDFGDAKGSLYRFRRPSGRASDDRADYCAYSISRDELPVGGRLDALVPQTLSTFDPVSFLETRFTDTSDPVSNKLTTGASFRIIVIDGLI